MGSKVIFGLNLFKSIILDLGMKFVAYVTQSLTAWDILT